MSIELFRTLNIVLKANPAMSFFTTVHWTYPLLFMVLKMLLSCIGLRKTQMQSNH